MNKRIKEFALLNQGLGLVIIFGVVVGIIISLFSEILGYMSFGFFDFHGQIVLSEKARSIIIGLLFWGLVFLARIPAILILLLYSLRKVKILNRGHKISQEDNH